MKQMSSSSKTGRKTSRSSCLVEVSTNIHANPHIHIHRPSPVYSIIHAQATFTRIIHGIHSRN